MKTRFVSFLLVLLSLLATTPLRAELVAYWPFENDTRFTTDVFGNNGLTINGNAQFTNFGKFDRGLLLDGDGDFLSAATGTIDGLPVGNSPYSIAAWIKTFDSEAGIIGWGSYNNTGKVNALRTIGNQIINYWWLVDLQTNLVGNPAILNGAWHHVAVTYDGTDRNIFINGELKVTDSPTPLEATANNFTIGTTNTTEYFTGTLDEVVIYNHALTANEISALFTNSIIIVTNTNDSGAGSLRQAIADCPTGGTIIFHRSLSRRIITLEGTELTIDKSLTIDATNLPDGLTIDGGGNGDFDQDTGESGCFVISDGNISTFNLVSLRGLTIQNGTYTGDDAGANIYNREDLALTRCQILDGRAFGGTGDADGGGIYNEFGILSLTQCTVSGNQTRGDNASGGGIYSEFGLLSLTQCTVSGNQTHGAQADGGGIYSANGPLSLTQCTISGNQTQGLGARGGGIYSLIDALFQETRLANCTIFGNSAANASGGGIFNSRGPTFIEHCTIVGNTAANGQGAGVSSSGSANATTDISNSIVRDNLGGPDLALSGGTVNSFTFTGSNLIGALDADITNGPLPNTAPLRLAPLGDYGGFTQTMHPLAGSPATGSGDNVIRTDQRGFNLTGPETFGAVKLGPITIVRSLNDPTDGDTTLRTAINSSATTLGAVIRFESSGTIVLATEQLTIPSTANGLFIDASDRTGGITIDADASEATPRRVMEIQPGATAALHGLTLTGGKTGNGANNSFSADFGGVGFGGAGGDGGGIYVDSNSSLTLSACTISGNRTGDGGEGDILRGAGGDGGGIYVDSNSSLTLSACTISGNHTGDGGGGGGDAGGDGGGGGGIYVGFSSLTLSACTISGNQTGLGSDGVLGSNGGVLVSSRAAVTLGQSIIAGNTGLNSFGVGDIDTDLGDNLLTGDPMLARLGHYGGSTQTMIPLPGSPAIDMATTSIRTTDQRGFPNISTPDIGATEAPDWTTIDPANLAAIWDSDPDGDGNTYGVEFALGTDPFVPDANAPANFRFNLVANGDARLSFGYNPDAVGTARWVLERSPDLDDWSEIFDQANPGGSTIITETPPSAIRHFYRFRATLLEN